MLILKKLRLKSVGRFVEEQTIDFESLGNLIQVEGQNNNTGGSSGAGKSTLFCALDYLFGFKGKPNTVLQSRLTEDHMWVEGVFDFDGKPLIITRGKKLSINLDGEITEGSSKIAEEKLDQILSIPRDLFRPILHKRQKEGGFFLKMTPKDMNDFLIDCLDLGHFKRKIDIVDKRIKELLEKSLKISNDLESAKSAIKATQEAFKSLGLPPTREVDQNILAILKSNNDISENNLSAMKIKHRLEHEQLQLTRPKIAYETFDISHRVKLVTEMDAVKSDIQKLHLSEKDRKADLNRVISEFKTHKVSNENKLKLAKQASDQAQSVALEIKKIRDNICPTCEQNWLEDSIKEKEKELLLKIKKLKEIIDEGREAQEALISINDNIERLDKELVPQELLGLKELEDKQKALVGQYNLVFLKESEFNTAQAEKAQYTANVFAKSEKELRERHLIEEQQASGQLELDRKVFEAAMNKFKWYEESVRKYEIQTDSLKVNESTYSKKIEEFTLFLNNTTNELSKAEELKRAIKSYLSCSFDNALEAIGEEATKIIRNIPNMANATITLTGTKETQDGKVKEEVNVVVDCDGEENIDIRSFSGGENTSVEFAVDLSVIKLIEERANKGANFLVLDEPFNGLESTNSEQILELLKNFDINKKIIIVDHNPVTTQFVTDKIMVVRDGLTSKIIQ